MFKEMSKGMHGAQQSTHIDSLHKDDNVESQRLDRYFATADMSESSCSIQS